MGSSKNKPPQKESKTMSTTTLTTATETIKNSKGATFERTTWTYGPHQLINVRNEDGKSVDWTAKSFESETSARVSMELVSMADEFSDVDRNQKVSVTWSGAHGATVVAAEKLVRHLSVATAAAKLFSAIVNTHA